MLTAGYSPKIVHATEKLTESKGWQELMNKHLPDSKLAAKHEAFLNSKDEHIGTKALDMAYKLKGSYAPEKSVALEIKGNIKDFAKHDRLRAEYEAKLLEEYQDE